MRTKQRRCNLRLVILHLYDVSNSTNNLEYRPMNLDRSAEIDAYLFDLDGTLLNTTPDIAHAVNVMRASEGLDPLSEDEVERGVGRGATELIFATTPPHLHVELTRLRERFVKAYESRLCVGTHPYPGAVECLNALKSSGARLGLVTNKPERLAVPLLQDLGWSDLFEVKLYGDSLPKRKPDPAPLLEAAKRLDVMTHSCVFIGDTEVDARAARAAEMIFYAVPWGRVAHSDEMRARKEGWSAHVLGQLSELLRLK